MAPLPHSCSFTKVLLVLYLVFVLLTLSFFSAYSEVQPQNNVSSRRMLELENESKPIKKKTNPTSLSASKNQTKLIKSSNTSSKNQTKQIKTSSFSSFGSTKNQTKNKSKLVNPSSNSTPTITNSQKLSFKSQLQKVNPTSSKPSISTKISSSTTKKSSDLTKISSSSSPKNKTTKATKPQLEKDTSGSKSKSKTPTKNQPIDKTTKAIKTQLGKDISEPKSKPKTPISKSQPTDKKPKTQQTAQKNSQYSWVEDDEDDLISGFRDLPSKFQETLLPDFERISKTSKVYLNKANKEITKNFKPYIGNKYASTIASIISFAFILIPLLLVSLIFNKIKAYFSLQKLLIFIQVYLSIYFSILFFSSLVTGLEPLKFFYATAQSTYICLQVLQTLAYVLYLLMLLMYLILVFSTETGPTTKLIGLAQTIVGFAVGLHYYMTVFHRAVLHQPPKTSWRVHAIYAAFFLVICLATTADRRKKAYLVQGGEVEKKS
ncbi:PREDICTED: uncharacterized serine-rich protein C215.13-like [Nicotiana attenuata]|uniref:Uncharacterized protein n=1 Tax=Nicotiana attenuata TaxID=49451 RepID=A0A1J6IGP2_NICAT|nr:PREDICTED: uncharacterized serine-rich protein C215.13-like [Nicotiana attenuata]OIT03826.1 hypothetical protein A4A49_35142 [Nicotiana attenuata]